MSAIRRRWRTHRPRRTVIAGALAAAALGTAAGLALAASVDDDPTSAPTSPAVPSGATMPPGEAGPAVRTPGPPASPQPTPDPTPATGDRGWDLVFAEEFDGNGLDTETWHTCHWWAPTTCTIETHDELSLYTADNVAVGDGVLQLQARRQDATGWNGKTYRYTSGMVSSGGSPYSRPAKAPGFTFQYGYIEARLKIPAGQGFVPAFWLLPDDYTWPPEIDIAEFLGQQPNRAIQHYHFLRANGTKTGVGDSWKGPDFSAGWHTFAVDWRPDSITWYIDGVERYRYSDPTTILRDPAYIILNLAVGGRWPGPPDATTPFPADYLVDYVRVFQRPA